MGVDKQYYAAAAFEVADGQLDSALMVKAMALAGGDEQKAKAMYIDFRAQELQSEGRIDKAVRVAAVAVGTAAGLTVGTAQAAHAIAKTNGAKNVFVVLVSIAGGLIGGWLAMAAGFIYLEVNNYNNDDLLNFGPVVLIGFAVGYGVYRFLRKSFETSN